MQYFSCGEIAIPLAMVSGASFTQRARTAEHRAGYRTARGLEAPEVSVRAHADQGLCAYLGGDARCITGLAVSCLAKPARLLFGSFEPFPACLFALVSVNRTYGAGGVEADLAFAAVSVSAQELKGRAPVSAPASGALPAVRLIAGGQALEVRGEYRIEALRLAGDGADLSVALGDDLAVPSMQGFLGAMDGAAVEIGGVRYASAAATLDAGGLYVAASLWTRASQDGIVETFTASTVADILARLCKMAGMECMCECKAAVSYYLARGTIADCIRDVADSAGLLLLFRSGVLCAVEAPASIPEDAPILEGDTDSGGGEIEIPTHCAWTDGLRVDTAGTDPGPVVHVASAYSGDGRAAACLARERLLAKRAEVRGAWLPGIEPGAAVSVQIGDGVARGIVVGIDADAVAGSCVYGVAYL